MQKLADEITFNQEIIKGIYNDYSRSVFCDAVRFLIENELLSQEEKQILKKVTDKIKTIPDFLRKSYFIYLSNGILSDDNITIIDKIKTQLIFELVIRFLEYDLDKEIKFENNDKNLFSLGLNRPININFDSIKKNEKNYIFSKENNEVLKLNKNINYSIAKDIDFLEQDKNPFNVFVDHPDEEFVDYDLKGIPKERWVEQFRNAYEIIKENVPEIYDEIYYCLDALVPHGYDPKKHLSSSYSKSPGILYLSYARNDIELAEAIIHEVHHTIFNIISWKYKLHNNDMSLKYYSAYRPDARHINGCFIGLHAFVAVQNFYRKLAENNKNEFAEKFFFLYLKNENVITVLEKYADLTPEGNLLFADVKNKYCSDTIFFKNLSKESPSIYQKALSDVETHLEEAKKRNKILLY